MRHAHDKDRDTLIYDACDHAIVTDPPAPITFMLALQRRSQRARILQRGDPRL
jgi:hypothetical protein